MGLYEPGRSKVVDDCLDRCLAVAFSCLWEALGDELAGTFPGDRHAQADEVAAGVELAVAERLHTVHDEIDVDLRRSADAPQR
jgi:hypothetical protein